MKGSMMDYPLTLQAILERIPKTYPTVEIVSRLPDGGLHRYTYLDFYRRTKALAEALHRAECNRVIAWPRFAGTTAPSGSLFWRPQRGRRGAHAESSTASARAGIHCESCAGPFSDCG